MVDMADIDIWNHLLPVLVIVASYITGFVFKKWFLERLIKLAKKSKAKLDDVFLDAVSPVIVLWFTLVGIYIATNMMSLSLQDNEFVDKVFQTLLIFSVVWFMMQFVGKLFSTYSDQLQKRIPASSIVKNTIRIFIFAIGFLVILQTHGISITPIITTLGVGGLAVALALQDTLANLFAGFQIIATHRVKPKDYIKLDSGEEGYVVDVTWRDTVLRQLLNNYVIIPNSKLSSSVVINYHKPKKFLNLLVEVGVDYTSDLEHVEKVTLEVARDILATVPGGVKKFDPFMRYHTFGDSSINFTTYLRCEEFFDRIVVQHEFIKRLKKRYDQEGINIPFPIRTVIMQKDQE